MAGWSATTGNQPLAAYTRFCRRLRSRWFFQFNTGWCILADKPTLRDTIALLRLSGYDSVFYQSFTLVQTTGQTGNIPERSHLRNTAGVIWKRYFHSTTTFDLAFEMAGIFTTWFTTTNLQFFWTAKKDKGPVRDGRYNTALCLYQLKRDELIHLIDTTLIGISPLSSHGRAQAPGAVII